MVFALDVLLLMASGILHVLPLSDEDRRMIGLALALS